LPVWIGVEHAVDEAHFQIRTGDQRRHVGRFDADVLESAVVGDLLAADVLHRDDSLGAQLRWTVGMTTRSWSAKLSSISAMIDASRPKSSPEG